MSVSGGYPDVEDKYDEVMVLLTEWDPGDHDMMYSDLWRKAGELKYVAGQCSDESEWCQRVYLFASDLKDNIDKMVDKYLTFKKEYRDNAEYYLSRVADVASELDY